MQPDRNVDAWFRNDPSWSIHCFEHTANEQYSNYTRHSKRAHSNPWNANGESSALLVECFPFLPLRRTRKTNQFIFVFSKQISRVYSPKSTAHTVSSRIIIHLPKNTRQNLPRILMPDSMSLQGLFVRHAGTLNGFGWPCTGRTPCWVLVCLCLHSACLQSKLNESIPSNSMNWNGWITFIYCSMCLAPMISRCEFIHPSFHRGRRAKSK